MPGSTVSSADRPIRNEDDPPMTKTTARLRDVAAAAGVDASVVSRVLSGDTRLSIRPETRQRVLDAATQLHYRPNTAARTLKTARTMAIGMIVPDLANVNYATIAQGAEEQAATAGYALLIASGSHTERARGPARANRRTSGRDGDERDARVSATSGTVFRRSSSTGESRAVSPASPWTTSRVPSSRRST